MPKMYKNEEDEEVEAFTPEEVKEKDDTIIALTKEKDDLLIEKKRLEDGSTDKNENIVKLRTSFEENKKQLEEVNKRLSDKEEYEKKTVKESLIKHYAGDDEESRKKLEAEYGFINLDESTPENIANRMEKAARVSGLYKEENNENPVFKGFWGAGGGPNLKPTKPSGDDPDNVLNTDKGKSALAAMGVPASDNK